MEQFISTIKYEVVIGLETEESLNSSFADRSARYFKVASNIRTKWQEYAKEFFDKYGTYVSAICSDGNAIYHEDWGCPKGGESVVTFHCTINPEFVKDYGLYEKGVLYITKNLKKEFEQHTITITKIPSKICYLTDKNDEEDK